jgi:hypothetical protein
MVLFDASEGIGSKFIYKVLALDTGSTSRITFQDCDSSNRIYYVVDIRIYEQPSVTKL